MFLKIVTATFLCFAPAGCAEIYVAVASNFLEPAKAVTERFEAETGHKVVLVPGSSGKHYAQIINGAPYEVFLSADTVRPALLEKKGIGIPGSRFTYAVGKLVLWSADPDLIDENGDVLRQMDFRFLSVANPKLAPYGKAAQAVLQAFGLWQMLQERIVTGENISQAYHFVKSGNADLGFIAFSQIKTSGIREGSFWLVPGSLYPAIEQQAVLLGENKTARQFIDFLKKPSARQLISNYGYDIPGQIK
jgi:molybdate transport system substrate-binding protein